MFTRLVLPNIRASELKKCFYCDACLPAKSGEHIFNACWGGSHQTTKLICSDCNGKFSEIDAALSVYTIPIMNAGAFKGGRRGSIPTIVPEGDYILEPGAKPKLKKPKVKVQPDGSLEIRLNSKTEAYKWFFDKKEIEAYLESPLTEEAQQHIRQLIKEAELQPEDIGPQPDSANINLQEQYRSAAHTLLKCLGLYEPDWVLDDRTSSVRKFARYNQGDWQQFAVVVNQYVSFAEQIVDILQLGVHHNSAEIYWCSSLKKVIGVVTLLDRVKRAVILAEGYSGADAVLSVVEDTYDSKKPPHALLVQRNPDLFCDPLIEILYSPPPIEIFAAELLTIGEVSYPLEALIASFMKDIEKISKQTPELSEQVLEEYKKLFVNFFLNMGQVFKVSIDSAEVRSKLSIYGFSVLAQHHIGKSCEDTNVGSIRATVFNLLLNDFERYRSS